MAKVNEIPEEGGNINWNRFEKSGKTKKRKKTSPAQDNSEVEEEKQSLTDDEQTSAYPDDFLADVNLMRKKIGVRDMPTGEEEISDLED